MKILRSISILILVLASLMSCIPNKSISLDEIPEYSDKAYIEINGNKPFFTADEITDVGFEKYSELDYLGRCGVAFASVGLEMMPDEERESITDVHPSGWYYNGKSNNNEYDFVKGGYIYNRCHLIGYLLTGENDNERNLITGTRYLNIEGMYEFENYVQDFIIETEYHVMYRVTPIYEGNNLVASGVLIEGLSVEDGGDGISFCVYAYNVQPGVEINYLTGENYAVGEAPDTDENAPSDEGECDFVLNTSSKKYHLPSCSHAQNMGEKNKLEFCGTPEDLKTKYPTYAPCASCKPE